MTTYLTRAERDLIVAVIRWCRANGWLTALAWKGAVGLPRWTPDGRWVDRYRRGSALRFIVRAPKGDPNAWADFGPTSVVQAVDVLTALGLLPAEFSSQADSAMDLLSYATLENGRLREELRLARVGIAILAHQVEQIRDDRNHSCDRACIEDGCAFDLVGRDGDVVARVLGTPDRRDTLTGPRCPSCGLDEARHVRTDDDGGAWFGCPVDAEAGETEGPGLIPDGGTD